MNLAVDQREQLVLLCIYFLHTQVEKLKDKNDQLELETVALEAELKHLDSATTRLERMACSSLLIVRKSEQ